MRFRLPTTWGERSGWVLAAFLFGVAIRSVDPLNSWQEYRSMWSCLFGTSLVLVWFGKGNMRFLACCALSACIGLYHFDATVPSAQDGLMPWVGQKVTMQGVVTDVQQISFGRSVFVAIDHVGDAAIRGPGDQVRLVAGKSSSLRPGDRTSVECNLSKPVDTAKQPKQRVISARQGIWALCGSAKTNVISYGSRYRPTSVLSSWRSWLTARIDASMPGDEAALLEGILYGERGMSPELKDAFRTAGLTHIIAVSGSNVSILSTVVFAFVLGIGLARRRAFWAMSFILIAFVGFVGASASVMRAAFMGWLALLGRETGRLVSTRRLLLIAAAILCLIDPWQLIYDIGFALSFLATIGLLELMPRLEPIFGYIPRAFGLRESVATTFSTTLLTAPYGAFVFDRMPLAGLLTNIFALPLVPWAMLWGACSALIGPTEAYSFLHWPARGALDLLILIGRTSQQLPWLDIRW